jgi:hypothetical protein
MISHANCAKLYKAQKRPRKTEPFKYYINAGLYRETLSATAGAGCVRVMEIEAFAV